MAEAEMSCVPDAAETIHRHMTCTGGHRPNEAAPREEREPFPLHMPGQDTFLFHRANVELHCASATPAIRILGLFGARKPNEDWAGEYYVNQLQGALDVCMSATFQAIPLPRDETPITPDEQQAKVAAVMERHLLRRDQNKATFERNVKEKKMGAMPGAAAAAPAEPPQLDAATLASRELADPLPFTSEVRGQKMVVCSVICNELEPVFTVYGVFENDVDAKHYIDATLSKHVKDEDLYVHAMYEWIQLTPTAVESDAIPTRYRDPTLDAIMKRKRMQGSDIDS